MATITSINLIPSGGNLTIEVVVQFTEVGTEPLSARVIGSLHSAKDSLRADYGNYDLIAHNGPHKFVIANIDLRRFPVETEITYEATLLVEAAKQSQRFVRQRTVTTPTFIKAA